MPTSTEWLIWALSSLADGTETKVDLLAILVGVRLIRLRSNTFRITPPFRIPFRGISPNTGVDLADGGRSKYVVALGDNIGAIFRWCSESWGNRDIRTDIPHDAVDRRVHAESLTDNGIKNWKLAEGLVGHWTETAIGVTKVFDLFLIKGFPIIKKGG